MARGASSASAPPPVRSGSSTSTATSTRSSGTSPSPKVYGICRLTWATTSPPRAFAASTAAGSTLTSTPSETWPPTGAEVCRTTTSGGSAVWNSVGTSESRLGT